MCWMLQCCLCLAYRVGTCWSGSTFPGWHVGAMREPCVGMQLVCNAALMCCWSARLSHRSTALQETKANASHTTLLKERIAARLRNFTEAYRDVLPALHSPARCEPYSLLVRIPRAGPPPSCSSQANQGPAANNGPSLPATQRPYMLLACCQAASMLPACCAAALAWHLECKGDGC